MISHGITWGRYYWPYLLLLVSFLFAVPEIFALITNHGNTLSEYAWQELHVGRSYLPVHTLAWWVSLTTWVFFVLLITGHIWWRQTTW